MKKRIILTVLWVFGLMFAPGGVYAEDSDVQNMRTEYEEISEIKMQRYDELTSEIEMLEARLEELNLQEQTLSGEKKNAEAGLAEYEQAVETARENIKKAREDSSEKDEKIRSIAETAAKDSLARRKEIGTKKAVVVDLRDKMKQLKSSKERTEMKNAASEKEYKDASAQLLALQGSGDAVEVERLQGLIRELETKAREGERLKQGLAEDILELAEKIGAAEDEISALERRDALRAKELRLKIESFGTDKGEDAEKAPGSEGSGKTVQEAEAKLLSAKAASKEIEAKLEKVSEEKARVEKTLIERKNELKVRISVLIVQNQRDQELFPEDVKAGEESLKKRLKRAETDVVSARRKAEKALWVNKEAKVKFDQEMLEKHFDLAVVYEMNGLYKDAEREYREALKINPKDADVHYNLAILYDDRLNNNRKAQKHYYQYLNYRPIGVSGERVRDWVLRAELERRLGKMVR